jgi:putative ABC transport system permease protein
VAVIVVRMALEASHQDVLRMVVRDGMFLSVVGAAIGLAGSLRMTRLMAGVLFETSPHDPLMFAAMTTVLLAVAFFACLVSARRATRVDPLVALRYE